MPFAVYHRGVDAARLADVEVQGGEGELRATMQLVIGTDLVAKLKSPPPG